MYIYPDINDRLTVDLISRVSKGNYWDESEKLVLDMCYEKMNKAGLHLDLGSGQGRLIEPFLSHASMVVAAEPDITRFEYSKKEGERLNSIVNDKEVVTLNGDIDTVTENGFRTFDTALSSHVIQHIPLSMTGDMLRKLSEIINPGGYVFVTATYNNSDTDRFTVERLDDNEKREVEEVSEEEFEKAFHMKNILPVAFYTPSRIIDLMKNLGFFVETVFGYHFYFDDHDTTLEDDIKLNKANDLSHARDVLYIFRKSI
ncbi:MAG: class I SAM-dependent methyltransferase [Clostridia bacterium]|nr:class I SAM-dependent methyltransferase [Clostridia bacterium]